MPHKFPFGGYKWVKNRSKFNKDFIKNYNEGIDLGYFLEADV